MADGCLDRILDCVLLHSFVFEVDVALVNLNDVTAVIAVLFIVVVTDSRVVRVITAAQRRASSASNTSRGISHSCGRC